ncbi:MAG: FeoC-like transcriptional regulator [Anaerolineae bacterium]
MLRQLLDEIRNADGPRTLADLSDALDVEPSAIEGMILYLAQKGRLRDDHAAQAKIMATCDPSRCGHACPGPDKCPYVMQMPPTYSLVLDKKEP